MKKIFAMMTILLLFVLACSNGINPDEEQAIPDASEKLNEGLNEANGKLVNISDMVKYYASEKTDGKDFGSILYLDKGLTELKMAEAVVLNGTFSYNPSRTRTSGLDTEINKLSLQSQSAAFSTFAAGDKFTFNNEVIYQRVMDGELTEITDAKIFEHNTGGYNLVTDKGYKLYKYTVSKVSEKGSSKYGEMIGDTSYNGEWNDGTGQMHYIIKKSPTGSKLTAIVVTQIEGKNNEFSFEGYIATPSKLSSYDKQ